MNPPSKSTGQTERLTAASLPSTHFQLDDMHRLHYISQGSGPLLVLIHGSLCDYRYWRWQMEQLGRAFEVVAPSLPGCWPDPLQAPDAQASIATSEQTPGGETSGPENRDLKNRSLVYSMSNHVKSIVALCDRLAPNRKVLLLGHSRGAQVALEAGIAMGDRLGSLILADPGFPFSHEPIDTPPIHVEIARKLGRAPLDDVLGEFVDAVNGAGTWRRTVTWFRQMVRDNAWTLLPQIRDFKRAIDLDKLSASLQCPVLLVGGEYSPQRYVSRIERLAGALPHAQRIVIARAAHGMNLANAPQFNAAVLQFLRAERA